MLTASISFAQTNIPREQNFQDAISFQSDISITISADKDDWAPTGFEDCTTIRLTCGSGDTITGMAGGSDGRIVTITNVGSNAATILSESDSSTAANRFKFPVGNLRLPVNSSTTFIYDATSSRWRITAPPYLRSEYKVLISQTSTSAPTVATTLINNIGKTVTWAYTSTGIYTCTITGYTAGKINVTIGDPIVSTTPVDVNFTSAVSGSDWVITIKTFSNDTLANAVFTATPFAIEIFP